MDNVLKFLIKLNADDGNLLSAARRVTRVMGRMEGEARRVGRALHHAFSPSSLGNALMSVPGMQFLLNPYTMIGAGLGAIAKIGAEAEMTARSFTTLVGSAELASSMLNEIKTFAASTPFSRLQLTANAQKMLNFGVESSKVLTYLKQLGDISGGDAERLSSLSLVFGQVSAAGHLMGQDLLQFVNAGFNPLQELSKMTGESYDALREKMSKGQITAENVAQAIAHATGEGGKFYGMMDTLSQTTQGQWQVAIGKLQDMAIKLFESIKPYIVGLLNGINAIIPVISTALHWVFGAIISVIEFFRSWGTEIIYVGGVLLWLAGVVYAKVIALGVYKGVVLAITAASKVWTVVQTALNAVLSANPIGIVVMAIGALVAIGLYCWDKFAGFRAFLLTMWDTLKGLGNIIKDFVIDRINTLLSGIGKLGQAIKLLLSGEWSAAGSMAKEALSELGGSHDAKTAASKTATLWRSSWQQNLLEQSSRDDKEPSLQDIINNGISTPGLKGSQTTEVVFGAGKDKSGKGGKSGEAIATGGQRNTQITMTIGKLIESLNVSMMDKTDSADLERVVLQSINRSLAIATSTDR